MEHTTETSATLAAGFTYTPARGWVVALLSRLQTSSVARPHEVAGLTSLVHTFAGLGYALGLIVTGSIAEQTGSLHTGCLTLCLCTSAGIIAGLLYPSSW